MTTTSRPHPGPAATLITGATGFVGGELLRTILTTTDRTVTCPVRANSDEHARSRGRERLGELLGPDVERHAHRVDWVRGDLEERSLGWTRARFADIAARTVEIFHCAASVSFELPLPQAHRINVAGTQNVFAVAEAAQAAHGRFVRFHHVSTAYVAGRRSGLARADELRSDRAGNYRNTYERTKARAERWLRSRASAAVPVTIHRPSIVGGHTATGVTDNWNVLYVPMKMVARGKLPIFSRGGRELVDSVGVDFVVRAMLVFAELDDQPLHCHHLTAGPSAFTVTDLMRTTASLARAAGHSPSDTQLVSSARWRAMMLGLRASALAPKRPARLARTRRKARIALRAAEKFGMYVPYTNVDVAYDATVEHEQLAAHGVVMPTGLTYLRTIIDHALAVDFGRIATADRAPELAGTA